MKNIIYLLSFFLIGGCYSKKHCLNLESKITELESRSAKVLYDGKWLKGEIYRNSEDPSQNGLVRFFVNENIGEYKRFWAAPFAYNNSISLVQFDTVYAQLYEAAGYYSARNLKKELSVNDNVYQPQINIPFGINIHSGHVEGGEHTKIHRNTSSIASIAGYTIVNVSPVDPITNELLKDPVTNRPHKYDIWVETDDFENLPTSVDIYWHMKIGVAGGQDVYSLSINHTHP